MSEEGKRDIKAKVPEWESELWSYISQGDGEHCPLYDNCPERQHGEWCFDERRKDLDRIVAAKEFNLTDYHFIQGTGFCKIFKLWNQVAEQWRKKWGVRHPPVPEQIVALADKERPIEIREVPLKSCHGALWRLKDSWVIQVNSNDPPLIRRFSIFHEAFHILAHCRISAYYNRSPVFSNRIANEAKFNEMLANHFAGNLIAPEKWIEGKWAETKDLDRLVEIFQCPKWSVCIGLKYSNIF